MKLQGKVCIVTGATSGMGKAIAESFLQNGASLILNGRSQDKGDQLLHSLQSDRVIFIAGDVADPKVNEQLVEVAIDAFGRLDIVVANAGVLGIGNAVDLSLQAWDQTIGVNLNSLFYLSKYSIPYLKSSKGTIIANASIAAFKSFPNHPAYCASKAAAVALVKQLATDSGPDVRVNAICPGPVDTPLIWDSAKAFNQPEQAVQSAAEATLMKRLGEPDDIAKLALFLASSDASWITGTAINIDGGIMA